MKAVRIIVRRVHIKLIEQITQHRAKQLADKASAIWKYKQGTITFTSQGQIMEYTL